MAYLMVVDDDEDFASAIAGILRSVGHEVRIELDTDSAIASMRDRRPDLVTLDVMFSEDPEAGLALARRIARRGGGLDGVRVLMLSAVDPEPPWDDDGEAGTWVPMAEYLEKPVNLDSLCRKVESMLGKGDGAPGALPPQA